MCNLGFESLLRSMHIPVGDLFGCMLCCETISFGCVVYFYREFLHLLPLQYDTD